MSKELRIGLVAEGPTDHVLIEAALKAILPDPFVLIPFQPEDTTPKLGAGWGGVLKWCWAARQRHRGPLLQDSTLVQVDLVIIHLDGDVAQKQYSDCGSEVVSWAAMGDFKALPCNRSCPPVSDTALALTQVMTSWLGSVSLGLETPLCLPAQSMETWLAAAMFPGSELMLKHGECQPIDLSQLPKAQRVRKSKYKTCAPTLTRSWPQVKQVCSQAEAFDNAMRQALAGLGR